MNKRIICYRNIWLYTLKNGGIACIRLGLCSKCSKRQGGGGGLTLCWLGRIMYRILNGSCYFCRFLGLGFGLLSCSIEDCSDNHYHYKCYNKSCNTSNTC